MSSSELTVSLDVDELAILPQKSSVEELLTSTESCRYELLPRREQRASEISKHTIGPVAGSPWPAEWRVDPLVTMRSVNLFKMLGAYYFPAFGVLIDRQGRAMRASMSVKSRAILTPPLKPSIALM